MIWPAMLAQVVDKPEAGDNAWQWVAYIAIVAAFAMAASLGGVFWRVLEDKDKQLTECREDGKTCATELSKTSGSLERMTDVSERQSQVVAEGFARQRQSQAEAFDRLARQVAEVLDAIAPRRRGA